MRNFDDVVADISNAKKSIEDICEKAEKKKNKSDFDIVQSFHIILKSHLDTAIASLDNADRIIADIKRTDKILQHQQDRQFEDKK